MNVKLLRLERDLWSKIELHRSSPEMNDHRTRRLLLVHDRVDPGRKSLPRSSPLYYSYIRLGVIGFDPLCDWWDSEQVKVRSLESSDPQGSRLIVGLLGRGWSRQDLDYTERVSGKFTGTKGFCYPSWLYGVWEGLYCSRRGMSDLGILRVWGTSSPVSPGRPSPTRVPV